MEKKIQTQLETQIEWLNNELEKDKIEVERNWDFVDKVFYFGLILCVFVFYGNGFDFV